MSKVVEKPPIIELRNVSKTFTDTGSGRPVHALQGLSLRIEDRAADKTGEFVVLLGPSGCGKSTILSLISGLALPDAGDVLVFGQKVTGPHKYSATVPQAYTCFPWLKAVENVEFGLALAGEPKEERRRKAEDYMRKVQLGDWMDAYHRHLSGGMQQRVAIARTLVMHRPIVLMDEPFGALDALTRLQMQQMLIRLWKAEKNTIIFVTHDITEAVLLADRIIVFSPRPAAIVEDLQDLAATLGFDRSPEIVNKTAFVEMAAKLRGLLKPPEELLAPPPPRESISVKITKRLTGKGSAAIAPAAPQPATPTRTGMSFLMRLRQGAPPAPAKARTGAAGATATLTLDSGGGESKAPEESPAPPPPRESLGVKIAKKLRGKGPATTDPETQSPAATPPRTGLSVLTWLRRGTSPAPAKPSAEAATPVDGGSQLRQAVPAPGEAAMDSGEDKP